MKRCNRSIEKIISERLRFISARSYYMIGYPEYIGGYYRSYYPEMFTQFIINVGNPFTEAKNYSLHTKDFEREVLHYFMKLYALDKKSTYGYIGNGTTEGSMYAIYKARETLVNPTLFFSEASHYSLKKIATLLRIPHHIIPINETGSINTDLLQRQLNKLSKDCPIIVSVTVGTTFTGAIDDVVKIHRILKQSGREFHIHLDAALFGGYLPFIGVKYARSLLSIADSIAFSLQKYFGVPLSTGIVLIKKPKNIKKVKPSNMIDYIGSDDSTISGTRNGAAVVMAYQILKTISKETFAKDARGMIERASFLRDEFKKIGIKALLLPHSSIVTFKKPSKHIVNKWQLATQKNLAHVVVLQHVTREVLSEFITDIRSSIKKS